MKEIDVPDAFCGCPEKNDGSMITAILASLLASLIPAFYTLISTYGVSIEIFTSMPDAYYLQAGIYLRYFSSSDMLLMYICLALAGSFIGAFSGSIGKTVLASFLFFVIYLISFVLLGLLFLGQEIDFAKFSSMGSIAFVIELLFVIVPAILISLHLSKRTKTKKLPYKVSIMKKMKFKKNDDEYEYTL